MSTERETLTATRQRETNNRRTQMTTHTSSGDSFKLLLCIYHQQTNDKVHVKHLFCFFPNMLILSPLKAWAADRLILVVVPELRVQVQGQVGGVSRSSDSSPTVGPVWFRCSGLSVAQCWVIKKLLGKEGWVLMTGHRLKERERTLERHPETHGGKQTGSVSECSLFLEVTDRRGCGLNPSTSLPVTAWLHTLRLCSGKRGIASITWLLKIQHL